MPSPLARRPLLAALLLALAASLLLAPVASSAPARAARASGSETATAAKACKQRKGESRKRWQKRCKCAKPKRGESRRRFKKRCPARKPATNAPGTTVPGMTAPGTTAPGTTAPQPLTGQAAIDAVTQAMKGMRISRTACTPSSSGGCSSSTSETIDFCSDGASFQGRTTREGLSGFVYESTYTGTWKVLEAQVNAERTLAQAKVRSELTSFNSNGDPAPASPSEGIVSLVGSNQVYIGQTEYTRGQAAC